MRRYAARERRVLREDARRSTRASFSLCERLLHPKQLRAVAGPGRRKVILGGRRGGKTRGIAAALLYLACFSDQRVLYITLTRQNAKDLVWDDLLALNKEFALRGDVKLGDLSILFPGGGKVSLAGANNEREIAKIRGKKWHLVVVDECQSIPDRVLVPLLGPVLAATLLDFGGSLWLAGSRPAVRAGHWFEVTEGKLSGNYEQHRFTVIDNTFLPARMAGRSIDDILTEFRNDNGWAETDITYRREVLNEDIEDLESLLFERAGTWTALPVGTWHYVFGVDQGSVDSDAIAVLGWTGDSPDLYLIEEFVKSGQDVTDLAEALKPLIAKYNPLRVVIDEGGGGKKAAEEIRRRHHIGLEAADKQAKPAFIRLINADIRKRRLLVPAGSRFAQDCALVQKDPASLLKNELREKPRALGGYHSDICDAVLYGWRAARHYLHEPPSARVEVPPEDEMEQRRLERIQDEAERPREWWDEEVARAA